MQVWLVAHLLCVLLLIVHVIRKFGGQSKRRSNHWKNRHNWRHLDSRRNNLIRISFKKSVSKFSIRGMVLSVLGHQVFQKQRVRYPLVFLELIIKLDVSIKIILRMN